MNESGAGSGRRETRLLLATIAISAGMLLLLARFRFPEEATGPNAEPAPAPLERLAARATYDELAAVMADLERRINPALLALGTRGDEGIRFVPAVRVTADRAVALLPADRRLVSAGNTPGPPIALRDPSTELVVVQTTADAASVAAFPATAPRPGPRYVAVAEATGGAVAIRPVYIGRADLFADPRWSAALISVAAVQQTLSDGSAVFSLDGTFLGLATQIGSRVAIIPSNMLREAAAGSFATPGARGELPIEVQPLTPVLATAAGAERGVMVSHVLPTASLEGDLAAGDVIVKVDGAEVTTVAGFQQVAQSRAPGAKVVLLTVRRGKPLTVAVVAVQGDAPAAANPADDAGMALRSVADVGSEVITVEPGGAAQRAGVRHGDLIVALEREKRPRPQDVLRAYRATKPGTFLLLTLRRDREYRVVALEKK
jgi:S1-C subfamily serine protease